MNILSFDNFITESQSNLQNGYIFIYGKEIDGKRRLYLAKVNISVYKRKKKDGDAPDVKMANISQDELYIVKEKDGKLIASRCMATGALNSLGLNSWSIALNDNKTPYHWATLKYTYPNQIVRELEASIKNMPNINLY